MSQIRSADRFTPLCRRKGDISPQVGRLKKSAAPPFSSSPFFMGERWTHSGRRGGYSPKIPPLRPSGTSPPNKMGKRQGRMVADLVCAPSSSRGRFFTGTRDPEMRACRTHAEKFLIILKVHSSGFQVLAKGKPRNDEGCLRKLRTHFLHPEERKACLGGRRKFTQFLRGSSPRASPVLTMKEL